MKQMKQLKKRVFYAMVCFLSLPIKLLLLIQHKRINRVLHDLCVFLQPKDYYLEYQIMPKMLCTIPTYNYGDNQLKKLGIILQGPICSKEQYTEETIKYYKTQYPEATIILSTWRNEDRSSLERIKKEGVIILENEDPKNPGVVNTNRQKISTLNGIKKAKELKLEYVAKTRTDQCLRRPHVFQSIINLLNIFPVDSDKLHKRIAVLPTICAGDLFYPYTFGDYFFMGNTDDMEMFWSGPDDSNPSRPIMNSKRLQAQYCNEGTMMRYFLNLVKAKCDYSIQDHWEVLKKYFICLDNGFVNLHYAKDDWEHSYSKSVNMMESEFCFNDDEERKKTENFGFANWINLYSGSLKYNKELEKYGDSKL